MTERVCTCGCNKPLTGRNSNAKFYNGTCRARYHNQNHKPTRSRPFVGLDGEGINSKYILLACGNGDTIQNRAGLSTQECLEYLVNLPRGSNGGVKPIYVWFAFDYDVNMMLRDIPMRGKNSIEQLRDTNKIWWQGFKITYIRRKILRIRYGNRVHTSYDVWGFFQSSFEKSLENWGVKSTELIAAGKAARGNFGKWSLKKIREYNADATTGTLRKTPRFRRTITATNSVLAWTCGSSCRLVT